VQNDSLLRTGREDEATRTQKPQCGKEGHKIYVFQSRKSIGFEKKGSGAGAKPRREMFAPEGREALSLRRRGLGMPTPFRQHAAHLFRLPI